VKNKLNNRIKISIDVLIWSGIALKILEIKFFAKAHLDVCLAFLN
jgi:hypothetical protein